jgi:hypothetical protein
MSKFYNVSDDTEEIFNNIFKKKSFPVDVRFQFVGSESQKNLIKISKIPDQFAFLLDKELLVSINDDLVSVFDDESVQILMEQEIDKVSINIDNGKIKLIKPDLTTFSGIVSKYGIEKVTKANGIEALYDQQKKDGKSDEFIV